MDISSLVLYAIHILLAVPFAVVATYAIPSYSFRPRSQGPIVPDSLSVSHALVGAEYSQVSKIYDLSSDLRNLFLKYYQCEEVDDSFDLPEMILYFLILPGFMYFSLRLVLGFDTSPIFFIIGYVLSHVVLHLILHIQEYSEEGIEAPGRPPFNPSTEEFITFWENEYNHVQAPVSTRVYVWSKMHTSAVNARRAMILSSGLVLAMLIAHVFNPGLF